MIILSHTEKAVIKRIYVKRLQLEDYYTVVFFTQYAVYSKSLKMQKLDNFVQWSIEFRIFVLLARTSLTI